MSNIGLASYLEHMLTATADALDLVTGMDKNG